MVESSLGSAFLLYERSLGGKGIYYIQNFFSSVGIPKNNWTLFYFSIFSSSLSTLFPPHKKGFI